MVDRVSRYILGVIFLVFGLNYFFPFLPMPVTEGPGPNFLRAIESTGYLMTVIKGVEVVVGCLFLMNRWMHLAILLIAPGVINICLFHVMLDPLGLPLAILLGCLWSLLVYHRREQFRFLLQPY